MRAGDESFERLRSAIEEVSGDDAAELVAEARVEARARVRSMLTEAMAQAMLERAREELERSDPQPRGPERRPTSPRTAAQSSRPPAPRPAPSAETEGDSGWYVYCVIAADRPAPPASLVGIDRAHAVTTVRHGALAAVVSQVPLQDFGEEQLHDRLADMEWLERTARRHEEVLDEIREQGALIPMRLCSIYRTESGVRELLRRDAEALEDALERLDRKTEWGVKVFAHGDGRAGEARADVSAPGADRPPSAGAEQLTSADSGATSGATYMHRRRLERQQRQQSDRLLEDACEQIHGRLCAVAVDGLTSPLQRPEVTDHAGQMILNGVYLVQDAEQELFHHEVQALQAEFAPLGFELEPTGPWPAYNFVPGTIGLAR